MRQIVKRQLQKAAITVAGLFLVGAGAVMMVTPGPGIATMIAGLAVLGAEYHWARRLRVYLQRRGAEAGKAVLPRRWHHWLGAAAGRTANEAAPQDKSDAPQKPPAS